MPRSITIALATLLLTSSSLAQPQIELSNETRLSLITVLPGDAIYSLWGHSAIRVVDPVTGFDRSFNYGTFSFETDWFVPKFLYGNLQYMLSMHDFDLALTHYVEVENRSVIEQNLNVSAAQRDSVIQFLTRNFRPENRFYTYDFLFDNCSTRIRDALEQSIGTDLQFSDQPHPGKTFRQLLDPFHDQWPFLDLGIDWLLGAPADRVALPYETMFLPTYLMDAASHATIDLAGERLPLVASTDTLYWSGEEMATESGFRWDVVLLWLVLGVMLFATVRAWESGQVVIRALDGPLFLLIGVAGVLIVFLWFISLHDVTGQNWNLLWAWPTHLIAAVALMRRRHTPPPRWLRGYMLASAVVTLVAVLGAPIWPQAFHPGLYPIMLMATLRAAAIFLAGRRRTELRTPATS